jgi:hypothetical protein
MRPSFIKCGNDINMPAKKEGIPLSSGDKIAMSRSILNDICCNPKGCKEITEISDYLGSDSRRIFTIYSNKI